MISLFSVVVLLMNSINLISRTMAVIMGFVFCSKYIKTWVINFQFLPARRYASAGNSDRNVSVRPSVTRRYSVKTKKASGMISSPSDSPKTLVS